MKDHPSRLELAKALVDLLSKYPRLADPDCLGLSDEGISIHLFGKHATDFDALRPYAEALGGGILPREKFDVGSRTFQSHVLTTQWQGVPVSVTINLQMGK